MMIKYLFLIIFLRIEFLKINMEEDNDIILKTCIVDIYEYIENFIPSYKTKEDISVILNMKINFLYKYLKFNYEKELRLLKNKYKFLISLLERQNKNSKKQLENYIKKNENKIKSHDELISVLELGIGHTNFNYKINNV
jgi:hypothetical protein